MNFTSQELEYLHHVLSCADNYTIARGEQIATPTVKHNEIKEKIKQYRERMHW